MRQRCGLLTVLLLLGCSPADEPVPGTSAPARSPETVAVAATAAVDSPKITEVAPRVAISERDVTYGRIDASSLNGFFFVPDDFVEPPPGVVLVHDWWGLDDEMRALARRLSGEGYAVLAVDLFGGQTAATAEQANDLMVTVSGNSEVALANVAQAVEYLDQYALAPRVGLLGFSLGGGLALEAALDLRDAVDAAVTFYGPAVFDQRLAFLDAPLLGIFAALDESVPVADVERLRRRLDELGRDAELIVYPRVRHAFASPRASAYDQATAEQAWEMTLEFLDAHLR